MEAEVAARPAGEMAVGAGAMEEESGQTRLTSFFATRRAAPGVAGKAATQTGAQPAERSKPILPEYKRGGSSGSALSAPAAAAHAAVKDGAAASAPGCTSSAAILIRRIDQAMARKELPLEVSCCPHMPAVRRSHGVLVTRRPPAAVPSPILASLAAGCGDFSAGLPIAAARMDASRVAHPLLVRSAVEAVSAAARAFNRAAFLPKTPLPFSFAANADSPLQRKGERFVSPAWTTGGLCDTGPMLFDGASPLRGAEGRHREASVLCPDAGRDEPDAKRARTRQRIVGPASAGRLIVGGGKDGRGRAGVLRSEGGASLKHAAFPSGARACVALPFGAVKPSDSAGSVSLSQVNEIVNSAGAARHAAPRALAPLSPRDGGAPVTPPHGALPAMRPAGLRLAGSPPVGSDIGELSLLCYEELDGVKSLHAAQMDIENVLDENGSIYASPRDDQTFRLHVPPSLKSTPTRGHVTSEGGARAGRVLLPSPLSESTRHLALPSPLSHHLGTSSSGAGSASQGVVTPGLFANFFASSPLLLSPSHDGICAQSPGRSFPGAGGTTPDPA